MITKERLKELIQQGATIYGIDYGRCLMADMVEIKTKDIRYSASNDNFQYIYKEDGDCYLYEFYEKTLFETQEEAEWHKEFGCIERTERLELPTWEKFQQGGDFSFIKRNGKTMFILNLFYDNEICIGDQWGYSETFEYTKDGYTLACRKCKELFLGERE